MSYNQPQYVSTTYQPIGNSNISPLKTSPRRTNTNTSELYSSSIPGVQLNYSDPFYEHRLHNLEINLSEDDTYSWPIFCRKSRIFKGKAVFHMEGYRALNELYERLSEWFTLNPNCTEKNFLEQEDRLNARMEGQVPYYGHLLIPVFKRTICRIDVKVFGQIVRLAGLDDYIALKEILTLMFDYQHGGNFFAKLYLENFDGDLNSVADEKAMNLRFKELLDLWRKDEEYYEAQENAGLFWFGGPGGPGGAGGQGGQGGPFGPGGANYIGGSGFGDDAFGPIEGEEAWGLSTDPKIRAEQIKYLKMEFMLTPDYQKIRDDIFNANTALLLRNRDLLNQNKDIFARFNKSDDEERYKLIMKENQRFKMELDLLQKELSKAKEESAEMMLLNGKYRSDIESMRMRLTHLEMFKTSGLEIQDSLPCLVINMSRSYVLIKTHCTDLLGLCSEFKQQIIEGIREDFKEINHDMSDNYEKSMIIREHLNRKDQYIKRIEELIK